MGLGAVLAQTDEQGHEHPIVYCSRKLLDREMRLSTIEKECLGIVVWSVKLLRPYLLGHEVIQETDHSPLVWLDQVKDSNQKLLRWSLA
jgi:predicted metal-binding transcription factor (methanogenesis marker protein 9)